MTGNMTYRDATWPELPLSAWKDTYATLHLWTQIVGKIRLAQIVSLVMCPNVRFGSISGHRPIDQDVRFGPKSGHVQRQAMSAYGQ